MKHIQHSIQLFLLILIILLSSCSGQLELYTPPAKIPDDRFSVPAPESREINTYSEYFEKQIILQMEEATNLSRQIKNLYGSRKEAVNTDAFGNVPNSSWFTNRNGSVKMSLNEIAIGPNQGNGPDTSGVWTVTRAKLQGVTPGFSIKDSKGGNYVIKFDPPDFAELASGAEVVSTKLFYAAGYNTPENFITCFHPKILRLDEKVAFTDKKGRKRFMKESDLEEILNQVETMPDGRIRALASKYLEGKPIGPFKYKNVRKDDLNDFIPHHHRRELRGLGIICAWLNHFDTKDGNTLDMYVNEKGRHFVKHFLIDFGATLGSASHGPNHLWRGYQNDIEPGVTIRNFLTLGLHVKAWEKQAGVKYPSVGLFNSHLLHPQKYKPQVPNPAFENATPLDGYWAAKIITSFTDDQIITAVSQGHYSNEKAAQTLAEIIIARRDIIGKYYFEIVLPLDNFRIILDEKKQEWLIFDDLALNLGYATIGETEYSYSIKTLPQNNIMFPQTSVKGVNRIPLIKVKEFLNNNLETKQIEVIIKLKRLEKYKGKSVHIYIDMSNENLKLLGIKRKY